MSNPSLLLKDGATALKQGDYANAIASLQAFCDSPIPPASKAYLQGHKWLVQAYVQQKETELALEVCLKMAESKAPAAEQWATQAIPKLQRAIEQKPEVANAEVKADPKAEAAVTDTVASSEQQPPSAQLSQDTGEATLPLAEPDPSADIPADLDPSTDIPTDATPADKATAADALADEAAGNKTAADKTAEAAPIELSPEELKQEIDQAVKAFRRGNHREVIERLEPLSDSIDPKTSHYGRAQMTLAKAYKAEEEMDKAIALGKTLMASDRDDISIWGKQFLTSLGDVATQDSNAEATDESNESAAQPDTAEISDTIHPAKTAQGATQSISGIPYQAPSGVRPAANAIDLPQSGHSPSIQMGSGQPERVQRTAYQRDPNDYTHVIQSALSHGSITFIVSWLLYWILPWSIAFCFDMFRFAVPVIIYCTATDPIAKTNAKEATNYVITMLIIMVLSFGGGIFLGIGAVALGFLMGPLIILLALPLIAYSLILAFYPVVGTIMCLSNPDKTFHYPRWLIWHAI